jgi:hypothetical protein
MSDDREAAALRRGLEVMTAWLEAKPGVGPHELMWQVIEANLAEGPEAVLEMALGLQALASILLVKLSIATNVPEAQILQETAVKRAT